MVILVPSDEVGIIFIARGETEADERSGHHILSPDNQLTASPHLVSNDAREIANPDLLICCTKTYQFEEALKNVEACIDENGMLLPSLNGADAT